MFERFRASATINPWYYALVQVYGGTLEQVFIYKLGLFCAKCRSQQTYNDPDKKPWTNRPICKT